MRMEKAVEEIMAEPARAPELLVRQDQVAAAKAALARAGHQVAEPA